MTRKRSAIAVSDAAEEPQPGSTAVVAPSDGNTELAEFSVICYRYSMLFG